MIKAGYIIHKRGVSDMAVNFGFIPTEQPGYYFISYNSEDADRIAPIVREMYEKGVRVWYDYGLAYGRSWKTQIAKHIEISKAVILFVTKNLLQRRKGSYAQIEYEIATDDYDKTVYVVFLDSISSSDVIAENKFWWHEIKRLHGITNADADSIMKAIGFQATDNSSTPASTMSPSEYVQLGDDYYDSRNGKPQEDGMAGKYYRLAVDQGNASLQNGLGYCYQYGLGVQQDDAMAVKYYRLAADQGNATAQFNLGWCYECGYGVSKDLNEAIHLYRLAAKGGSNDAKKALARLGVSE